MARIGQLSLEFRHIAHAYGSVRALEAISFAAPRGKITCLLGASGCGKSTLLNLAAGLLPVQQGSIELGGALLADTHTNPPPEQRAVGLVFQDGALFPHMSVAKNVGFGLGKTPHRDDEIAAWLALVGLEGLGDRYPHELSGGQQQRAALARAMAPKPEVLLLDEPFASVDIVLRRKLRRECRKILREQGTTAILVTHDPDEALDIADQIAVMEAGRIVQLGTPDELHKEPATPSIGAMFGGAQIVPAIVQESALVTAFGTWPRSSLSNDLPDAERLELLVHAKELELAEADTGFAVRDVHPLGGVARVLFDDGAGQELAVETARAVEPSLRYAIQPTLGSARAFAMK